jgi:peptide/nickel transport system permease protein
LGRSAGIALLGVIGVVVLFAPVLSPNSPTAQFDDRAYAPPMRIHVRDHAGFHAPFVYRQVLDDRLMRRYHEDPTSRLPLAWLTNGRLVSLPAGQGPLLLLGGDALGRDLFARLLHGSRWSLGVALAGVLGALALGALVGGLAGATGGRADAVLMLLADFLLVLPGAYLVLVLRGVLPLVLSSAQVFWLMAGLFAIAGWPHVARGVRAIVLTERAQEYAEAARAAGAGAFRLLGHLLPAARGFLAVEIVLLVPALLVAEATISFLGLGFPPPTASWGTLLQDAANIRLLADAPWILSPALALFLVVLGVQLVASAEADRTLIASYNGPGLSVRAENVDKL